MAAAMTSVKSTSCTSKRNFPPAAAAQFAFATPAVGARATQRATPAKVAEAVADVAGFDAARAQDQLALRCPRGPVQAHVDILQRGDTGGDFGDARLHRARVRHAHAGQQQPWQQA